MSLFRIIPLLFPTIVEALIALRLPFLGRILSLFQKPISDTDALRQLEEAQNWRPKQRPAFNDGAHVIKVSEAIKCVQGQVNNRLHWLAVAKEVVRSLLGTPRNSMSDLGDAVAECLREKSLRQDTERSSGIKKGYHRPALGHGRGRRTFR